MTVDLDPVSLEVFRHRLDTICDEMHTALVRSAVSNIIKEGGDASPGVFTLDGELVSQAIAYPIHFGMLVPAVARILEAFPIGTMQPGDRYILSDPYQGGTHLPDVTMVAPIFDGDLPVALACNIAHHQDVGGRTAGSLSADATDIFNEGIRIPAIKAFENFEMVPVVRQLLECNVRLPEVFIGDLYAQSASCTIGQRRFPSATTDLALSAPEAMSNLLDRTESMTRAAIRALPDGSYTFRDYLDNDGIVLDRKIAIQATVEIRGGEVVIDLTGSSPQVDGPVNSIVATTMAVVYFIAVSLLERSIPRNAGCFRAISATLPPRSVVNPDIPAAVGLRIAVARRIYDAATGALLGIDPRLARSASSNTQGMTFGGIHPRTGKQFVILDVFLGGMGARPDSDGVDTVYTDLTNQLGIPVEAFERDAPLRILEYSLREDSGGPGQFRGGLGCHRVFEILADGVTVSIRGDRYSVPPWGARGGLPGARWETHVERPDGSVEHIQSKGVVSANRGTIIRVAAGGGGGFGPPALRDSSVVRRDVIDGRVSRQSAQRDYGVILTGPNLAVDEQASVDLRSTMSTEMSPVINRGVDDTGFETW